MSIDIEQVAKLDWEKKWTVPFTFLLCSYVVEEYYPFCLKKWGITYRHAFLAVNDNRATCYLRISETERIGKYLDAQISPNFSLLETWGTELHEQMKNLDVVLGQDAKNVLDTDTLFMAEKTLGTFITSYIQINRSGNHLGKDADPRILSRLDELRLFSEPAYGNMDVFFRRIVKCIAEREKVDEVLLQRLASPELRMYVKEKTLPDLAVLQARLPTCGLYMQDGKICVVDERIVKRFGKAVEEKYLSVTDELAGQTASAGVARGRVRVVMDPSRIDHFEEGDILVAEATRPDYVPLMKKAAAIITDSGGMLSHAAVVSREMKKPCVVGLQVATRVFKDGDLVEVDATRGIVKKI